MFCPSRQRHRSWLSCPLPRHSSLRFLKWPPYLPETTPRGGLTTSAGRWKRSVRHPCSLHAAKTQDQQKLLADLLSALETRNLDEIVFLTAARGRGKSAALGLALAGALALRYTNIVLSAPSPDNLTTVFDFISKGLEALGLMASKDFILVQADLSVSDSFRGERQNRSLVRLNLSVGGFRQAVQYVSPTDPQFFAQAELVVVDECAAIPLTTTRELINNSTGMFIMSSTVCGYEGTGRGLTMKLLKDLRAKADRGAAVGAARFVTELTLTEPIRYSQDDPIEKWLNSLLCLEVEEQKYDMGLAAPRNCVLYELNRDLLFSGDERTERCLHSVLSLFVTSHYKNSPNDLLTMADAPNHRLFVLCAPLDDTSDLDSVRPLAAVQLAFEGRINRDTSLRLLASGTMPQGDLIPWTLGQFFDEPGFGEMTGARVVRIACHPSVQSMGYGSQAVKTLSRHLSVPAESDERDSSMLLYPCEGSQVQCEYLGTSFGSTQPLVNFWARMQFESVFLSTRENEVTGSHSCIMVRALTEKPWLSSFTSEFRHRLVGSLGSKDYADLTSGLALSMLHGDVISEKPALNSANVGEFYTYRDVHRLQKYIEMTASFASVQDLLPLTSSLFFTRRLQAELTFSQQAVLLAVGIQRRNFGQVAQEFGLTVSQCIALFQKGTAKIVAVLGDIIQEKESAEAANEAAPNTELPGISPTDLSTTNLNQELAMAGKKEEARHKRQKSRMVQQAKKIKR
ncbi:MAG: hypothetical protein KVP17_004896 [Porospora cf. gigantea B]|uniref:uncharacterized protein n=1 Tax=Porospora cf. gigantea B TaxID=2853592 RepID=UPI003571CD58|nr:MAG: hypothetical protein KVP17_004896 [Porospora cf. gigantea B]